MKRFGYWLLSFILFGLTLACSVNKLQTVKPELYSSLPQEVRDEVLKGRASEIRILDGKISKVKTDLQEHQEKIRLAYDDVQARREEIVAGKKFLHELKKGKAGEHEIKAAKKDVKEANKRWDLARQIYRYELQRKVIFKNELEVLEWEKKSLLSKIEWEKLKMVHEYTDFGVSDANVQVAKFRAQYRRFKLQESQARYDLAKSEVRGQEVKLKVKNLEKGTPLKSSKPPTYDSKTTSFKEGDLEIDS